MTTRFLSGLITAACWFLVAGQPPAPPKTIFGLYGKTGRDSIRVTPAAQGKVALRLKLYYANGHTCALDKEGEWHGDHLRVLAEGLTENEPCTIEASFSRGRILLKDEGQPSAPAYLVTPGK